MVQFNELKITPDGINLIIDVSIKDYDYYENIFLDSVIIDNQDTFTPNGPSSNPIYSHTVKESLSNLYSTTVINNCNPILEQDSYAPCYISDYGKVKNLRLTLSLPDFMNKVQDLDSNLFFIYVIVKGSPAPDTPCGMDNQKTMGVVFNKLPIYNLSMNYFRELESNCSIPKNLIDSILKFKGLELSLTTGNYTQAIKYWNKFFKNKTINNIPQCNCRNGRIN